jgi:RimJ/RimL family protein N-acetyltransferase
MRSADGEGQGELSPRDFVDRHRPALERDEVRHNVLIAILNRLDADEQANIRRWTLGEPGACAVQGPPFPIVLGELTQAQCHALAELTRELDYPGVVGPDLTTKWFAERATALGVVFGEPVPQKIHALRAPPRYPGAPGSARPVWPEDAALLFDWTLAFVREAVQHDPEPTREQVERHMLGRGHTFWIVDGVPVSMAAIARRLRDSASISAVYTPPDLRGRGYAGSAVAAVVEQIFAEGRSTACLYTDLRNPFSNRCYAKVGFEPVCESWHCPRAAARSA